MAERSFGKFILGQLTNGLGKSITFKKNSFYILNGQDLKAKKKKNLYTHINTIIVE